MSKANDDEDEGYEVGKNKPPKQHQWKKGQSGNPAGSKGKRPPVELPFAYWIADTLKEEVAVSEDGKHVKMPMGRALAKRLMRMTLTADPLRLKYIFGILNALNVFPLEEALIRQKAAFRKELEELMKELKKKDDDDNDGLPDPA